MKRMLFLPVFSLMLSAFILTGPAAAQMPGHGMSGASPHGKSPHPSPKGHPGSPMGKGHPMSPKAGTGYTPPGHAMGHIMGPRWKDTLTDEQKKKMDEMHLVLEKTISVVTAKKDLKKKELRLLIIQDKPDMKAIEKKVNEITELAGDLMLIRIGHKTDMRAMLTPEQRVSFDMMILNGPPHGK
ncbi:MAG TPA: Spy/CpxP family protein refolding chaperone [Nitrospiria bacterium]